MKNEKILVQIFAAPIRFSQDTRGKLNATGRSEDVLNVLCMFNLRPVSRGYSFTYKYEYLSEIFITYYKV